MLRATKLERPRDRDSRLAKTIETYAQRQCLQSGEAVELGLADPEVVRRSLLRILGESDSADAPEFPGIVNTRVARKIEQSEITLPLLRRAFRDRPKAQLYVDPSAPAGSAEPGNKNSGAAGGKQSSRAFVNPAGAELCGCLATDHPLVSNCLTCGRVVCEREAQSTLRALPAAQQNGPLTNAPCPFCGVRLSSGERLDEDDNADVQQQLQKAVAHKNRLLGFAAEGARRTRVHDDQSDYFSKAEDRWASAAERDAARLQGEQDMHAREHAKRLVKLDLGISGNALVAEVAGGSQSLVVRHELRPSVSGAANVHVSYKSSISHKSTTAKRSTRLQHGSEDEDGAQE